MNPLETRLHNFKCVCHLCKKSPTNITLTVVFSPKLQPCDRKFHSQARNITLYLMGFCSKWSEDSLAKTRSQVLPECFIYTGLCNSWLAFLYPASHKAVMCLLPYPSSWASPAIPTEVCAGPVNVCCWPIPYTLFPLPS